MKRYAIQWKGKMTGDIAGDVLDADSEQMVRDLYAERYPMRTILSVTELKSRSFKLGVLAR